MYNMFACTIAVAFGFMVQHVSGRHRETECIYIHSRLNENIILVGGADLFFLEGMEKHREGLFIDYCLLLRAVS